MGLPTCTASIERAEREIGQDLPNWLRLRLLRDNGGTVEACGEFWQLFSVLDTTDRRHVTRSATHIVRETRIARSWPGFPPAAVAIGANGAGDYLILLPNAGNVPSPFEEALVWRHGTDDPPVLVQVVTR